MRLAVVTSHPIQYNAPIFQLLTTRGIVELKVFYTWSQTNSGVIYDPGFAREVKWDIPLLDGYSYQFVENIAKDPGTHHYNGIKNPHLHKLVEQWKPDAILVITWALKSHFKCMRFFHKKTPILFRGDSTLLNEQKGWRKLGRTLFLKWVYRYVDFALYVGKNNKNYYLKHGLKENQLVLAPHAIDNFRFFHNTEAHKLEAAKWRKDIGIEADAVVFLYAGKLEQAKNPELLIEAFLELQSGDVHLVLVGNGVKEKELKNKYAQLRNIHFIDFQNQTRMPIVYHLCDVFVLTSRSETWGLAINEAMACGKPIIASNKCGGAIDLIEENTNGYIFESENKKDLAEKMTRMLEKRYELKKMGQESLNKIQNFSFEGVCKQIETLMQTQIKVPHGV